MTTASSVDSARTYRPFPTADDETALLRRAQWGRPRTLLTIFDGPLVHRRRGRLRPRGPRKWLAANLELPPAFGAPRRRDRLGPAWHIPRRGRHPGRPYGGRSATPVQVELFNMEYARRRAAAAGELSTTWHSLPPTAPPNGAAAPGSPRRKGQRAGQGRITHAEPDAGSDPWRCNPLSAPIWPAGVRPKVAVGTSRRARFGPGGGSAPKARTTPLPEAT